MEPLSTWLREIGLERYFAKFAEHEIDLQAIALLTEPDLRELGLPLGPRKKLLKAISDLNEGGAAARSTLAPFTQAERRQLTVMFCDVVGWTSLSERLDPELLGEIAHAYQTAAGEVIRRYEGHVAQYLGDGLLAYFGYPRAHEDDGQRAVLTAMGILTAIGALNSGWAADNSTELSVRIGIDTGMAVVGQVGDNSHHELLALGEAPNVAARLQALADPNAILISERTFQLTSGAFEFADLGEQPIKGLARRLQVWRVLGHGTLASRFDASARNGLTPMVNREQELSLLAACWERSRKAQTQVVLMSGEAGVGKSRLLRALHDRLGPHGHGLFRFQCSPYHTNTALYPIVAGFSLNLRLDEDVPPAANLDKIESLVAGRYQRPTKDVQLIASVLSVDSVHRYGALTLTPKRQKEDTIRALLDLLHSTALEQPSLIVFEDTHWADPTTMEFLDNLIHRVSDAALLVIITQRSHFASKWSEHSHVTSLPLEKFSRVHSEALVSKLTRGKQLPANLVEHVITHADGVPLFVEELTKALIDSSSLKEGDDRYEYIGSITSMPIPSTLRDSLIARLERSAAVKAVAQVGAAIGREFNHRILAAVAEMPTTVLNDAIGQLIAADVVSMREVAGEMIYVFKHALVRDAAYDLLLKSARKHLHANIASALENDSIRSKKVPPELLAYHFTEAGLTTQAVRYWLRAGDNAAARSANIEAENHLQRALELLGATPENAQRELIELEVRTSLGPVLVANKGYTAEEVDRTYARAQLLVQRVGAAPQLFSIVRGQFQLLLLQAKYPIAERTVKFLLALADDRGDVAAEVDAKLCAGLTALYRGRFRKAHEYLRTGAQNYDPEQHRSHSLHAGVDLGVGCVAYDARTLWFLGYPDQAVARGEEAIGLAQAAGLSLTLTQALGMLGIVHQARRDHTSTMRWIQKTIEHSAEHGHTYWIVLGDILRGWLLAQTGEPKEGAKLISLGLANYRATGARLGESWFYLMLADAYEKNGQFSQALAQISNALEHIRETEEEYYAAEVHRIKGELLLVGGKAAHAEVEVCFRRALEIADRQDAKGWELRAAMSMATLLITTGRRKQGRNLLEPVYNWFTEGISTLDLQEAKALLESC
jgi:class 3 adenylate cyclase/predicted ATPase